MGSGNNSLNADSTIKSIIIDTAGNVYAGGSFKNNNGKRYVAQWNGTNWNELGSGNNALNANQDIRAIATDNLSNIYAGGLFKDVGGNPYVAKWDNPNTITSTILPSTINKITVYPNPSSGIIYVKTPEPGQLTICDISGNVVFADYLDQYDNFNAIDLNKLINGLYILRFNGTNNLYSSLKLIRQ